MYFILAVRIMSHCYIYGIYLLRNILKKESTFDILHIIIYTFNIANTDSVLDQDIGIYSMN